MEHKQGNSVGFAECMNTNEERRDAAVLLMPSLDYESQLIAITGMLNSHRQAEEDITAQIKRIERVTRRTEHTVDAWIEKLHQSSYQGAAHSMAAVGMVAPLIESMFDHAYREIGCLTKGLPPLTKHHRLHKRVRKTWDCHCVLSGKGKWSNDLVKGIVQLADAVGLEEHLPRALEPTLSALIAYRNKMFHCGFEWPIDERKKFETLASKEKWPTGWFSESRSGTDPWMFYMSEKFIDQCLTISCQIITGIGGFCLDALKDGRLPIGPSEPMPGWMRDLL